MFNVKVGSSPVFILCIEYKGNSLMNTLVQHLPEIPVFCRITCKFSAIYSGVLAFFHLIFTFFYRDLLQGS